jgi:hypothetical protein
MEHGAAPRAWVNQVVMLELLGEPSATEPGLGGPLGLAPVGRLSALSELGVLLELNIGDELVERFYPWTAARSIERRPEG